MSIVKIKLSLGAERAGMGPPQGENLMQKAQMSKKARATVTVLLIMLVICAIGATGPYFCPECGNLVTEEWDFCWKCAGYEFCFDHGYWFPVPCPECEAENEVPDLPTFDWGQGYEDYYVEGYEQTQFGWGCPFPHAISQISHGPGGHLMGMINYFIPFGEMAAILTVWLAAIAAYYIASAFMRWAKLVS